MTHSLKVPQMLFVLIAGILLNACQTSQQPKITVVNPMSVERPDARIVIPRDSLAAHYPGVVDQSFVIRDAEGDLVPFQRDDLDRDGQWDELALLYSLPPNGSTTLDIKQSAEAPDFSDRANIRFAKYDSAEQSYHPLNQEVRPDDYQRDMDPPYYYQFEGPGWESDKIGFRMYFDQRNAFDIWGKTTTDMVLDQVGTGEDYHQMQPWGMDILHVGRSLGAGGIAMMYDDSLYALGATDHAEFTQVTDGPVRAVLDLTYRGWSIAGYVVDIRERISIWGGQPGFQNEVMLQTSDFQGGLVAGFVTEKLPGKTVQADQPSTFPWIAGWGEQSADSAGLGMAVVGQPDPFESYGSRSGNPGGVAHTSWVQFNLTAANPVTYRFVAGWETGNENFSNKEYFFDVVKSEGQRLNNPVEVRY